MTTTATPLASAAIKTPREQFLEAYEREHATTMRVLRAYPPDKVDLKPHPKCKTARELAWMFVGERSLGKAGLANAFEATFHVRILDAGGHALADGPAMATCGTGCWGAWDLDVPYVVAVAGPGTLQAYELSAADGSPTNLTAYPVTLRP